MDKITKTDCDGAGGIGKCPRGDQLGGAGKGISGILKEERLPIRAEGTGFMGQKSSVLFKHHWATEKKGVD